MNSVDARSRPMGGGVYHGEFKRVHKADFEPVREGGKPRIFFSAFEAECFAWRSLRDHLQSQIVGEGEGQKSWRKRAHEAFKARRAGR